MAGEDHSSISLANPAVQSCWLCGTRLPAREMVADGGTACADLRWYCADTRRCTERWTSRWSTGVGGHGRTGIGHAGNGHAAQGLGSQGPGSQGHSAVQGQGSSGLPVRGRGGVVQDPRGRQLTGLSDY